jgi:hypothetical protein
MGVFLDGLLATEDDIDGEDLDARKQSLNPAVALVS